MEHKEYKSINKSVRKKDSMQLLLGKPVYTDDVTPDDALVVKILRSPHANAIVESINTAAAKKVPGVVDIYTWEDVSQTRFAIAGQTFPEPSPYDRLIIDRHVRFSGDAVAIIAAETEKAALKAMMEPFTAYANFDRYGRLHLISSTQIVFHTRRILSRALGIPKSKIRVEKPRIGGGFGAKQTAVCDVYPAFVAMKTGRPARIIYTREESQIAGSPRHEMEITLKVGATKEGKIRVMDLYTLSNTGAYGEHGPTTVGLSGHKALPLYTGSMEAFRFHYDVVYTNHQAAGAYRGYGATQGIFAVESIVSELAEKLGMDATAIRDMNMIREGMLMPAYYNEIANSCALDRCMEHCRQMFNWEERSKIRDMGNGKVRTAGVAMACRAAAFPMWTLAPQR